jgi:hypothetical protein
LFADIVAREFDERLRPSPAPPAPESLPPPVPPPVPFELNLYDDDESYRDTAEPAGFRRLSLVTRAGVILLAVATVGGMLMVMGIGAPRWMGWLVALLFGTAVAIGIIQMVRRAETRPDDEDGAEV